MSFKSGSTVALLALLLNANNTFSSEVKLSPSDFWTKTQKDFNILGNTHSFCYQDENGKIQGVNPHMKVRLASVSKLYTTLWAIDKLGSDFEYESKFHYDGKNLHIEGSLDPVYSDRKLFFIISQLNNLGIKEIETLSFDKNLNVFTRAEWYSGVIIKMTPERTKQNLKDFLNTSTWNRLKQAYKNFVAATPDTIIDELQIRKDLDDIELKVKEVKFVEKNPMENRPETYQVYSHLSPIMAKYLKVMNVRSNNYYADQIFDKLGGMQEFNKYYNELVEETYPNYETMRKGFLKGEATVQFQTGSGLDSKKDGSRFDNYSTCAITLEMVKKLKIKIEEQEKEVKKIVAVPGTDLGTFRKRLRGERTKNSMLLKTGTLRNTSALAGILKSKNLENIYFGVFHQLTGWKGNAKMVQNKMAIKLIDHYGGPNNFEYSGEFFFPAKEIFHEKKASELKDHNIKLPTGSTEKEKTTKHI